MGRIDKKESPEEKGWNYKREMLKNRRRMGGKGHRRRRERMAGRSRRKVKRVSEGKNIIKGKEG